VPRISISEDIFNLIVEGRVRVVRDRKLKFGKYRIVGRYVKVR